MEGPKLEWMYKNSNDIVDKEEYLLGKPIDKAFEQSQTSSLGDIEKDCLPTSIFANAGSNVQVDVIRKLKEDPLEAIRQQEIERRKQLLRNPIKLKKLQNMLKVREDEVPEDSRKKKKKKKKHSDEECMDIDGLLASKYSKIMKKHGIKSFSELAQLKVEKNKKKSKKSKKKETSSSESDSSDNERPSDRKKGAGWRQRQEEEERRRRDEEEDRWRRNGKRNEDRSSHQASSSREKQGGRHRNRSPSSSQDERTDGNKPCRLTIMSSSGSREHSNKAREKNHPLVVDKKPDNMEWKKRRKEKLSEKEREERLKEMMDNAKWRDEERKKNVAHYKKEDEEDGKHKYSEDFMR